MLQIICILVIIIGLTVITPFIKNMGRERISRILLWVMFSFYISGNMYFTMLSRNPGATQHCELHPLKVYSRLFEIPREDVAATGFAAKFLYGTPPIVGLILNIFLYYPLGYMLLILFPKLKPKQIVLIGCLCSIATEAAQYFLKIGWCEIDDVIHNTIGAAIGVWVCYVQQKQFNRKELSK